MTDCLQTCLNEMEALQDAAICATAYRMHCHAISACAQGLRGLTKETQKELMGIGKTEAARFDNILKNCLQNCKINKCMNSQ